MPVALSHRAAEEKDGLTFDSGERKLSLQIIDDGEEGLDVQDKPLSEQDYLQQLSRVHCSEHISNESG